MNKKTQTVPTLTAAGTENDFNRKLTTHIGTLTPNSMGVKIPGTKFKAGLPDHLGSWDRKILFFLENKSADPILPNMRTATILVGEGGSNKAAKWSPKQKEFLETMDRCAPPNVAVGGLIAVHIPGAIDLIVGVPLQFIQKKGLSVGDVRRLQGLRDHRPVNNRLRIRWIYLSGGDVSRAVIVEDLPAVLTLMVADRSHR